jgi:hypothetical protein
VNMRRPSLAALAALAALALATTACEGVPPEPSPDAGTPLANSWLPLRVGNSWTYRTVSNGSLSNKTSSVEAEEPVGGDGPDATTVAFRMRTQKVDDFTLSWQGKVGDRIVRYREEAYKKGTAVLSQDDIWTPARLVVDGGRLTVGASYEDRYLERAKDVDTGLVVTSTVVDVWTVESVDAPIDVPGRGPLPSLLLRKQRPATGLDKRFWFVKGVGKVREEGGQLEQLTGFEVRE